MLAQLIMLIVMCMQRHWLYAAMLAPSLLGSALMLITMIMRVRHEETNSNTITGAIRRFQRIITETKSTMLSFSPTCRP